MWNRLEFKTILRSPPAVRNKKREKDFNESYFWRYHDVQKIYILQSSPSLLRLPAWNEDKDFLVSIIRTSELVFDPAASIKFLQRSSKLFTIISYHTHTHNRELVKILLQETKYLYIFHIIIKNVCIFTMFDAKRRLS